MSDENLNLFLKKGNFSQVPNEMLESFARLNLSPTEYKICFFLMRELVGWDYPSKPIEIHNFMMGTNSCERAVKKALTTLVGAKVLLKSKIPKYRTPCYGFNPEILGRLTVSEPRKYFVDGENVIDLQSFKLSKVHKSADLKCTDIHSQDAQVCTQKRQDRATRAAEQDPKYPQTPLNTHTGKDLKIDKKDWVQVRAHLLTKFPKDEKRLDGTFKQICDRGYEQEGKTPFYPNSVSAWLFTVYEKIRDEYAHHDGRKYA